MKKIIAVDLDDVLAASAEGWIAYSNKKWGTKLTTEDYDEHWGKLWGVDHEETRKRAHVIYNSKIQRQFIHFEAAKKILSELSDKYKLVITTSRHKLIKEDTIDWLEKNYKDIFSEIYFAGIWDQDIHVDEAINLTKAALCQKIGASYLIDDHPKHCIAANRVGVKSLLFGDYSWNRNVVIAKGITRVKDWQAVKEYFNERD